MTERKKNKMSGLTLFDDISVALKGHEGELLLVADVVEKGNSYRVHESPTAWTPHSRLHLGVITTPENNRPELPVNSFAVYNSWSKECVKRDGQIEFSADRHIAWGHDYDGDKTHEFELIVGDDAVARWFLAPPREHCISTKDAGNLKIFWRMAHLIGEVPRVLEFTPELKEPLEGWQTELIGRLSQAFVSYTIAINRKPESMDKEQSDVIYSLLTEADYLQIPGKRLVVNPISVADIWASYYLKKS